MFSAAGCVPAESVYSVTLVCAVNKALCAVCAVQRYSPDTVAIPNIGDLKNGPAAGRYRSTLAISADKHGWVLAALRVAVNDADATETLVIVQR